VSFALRLIQDRLVAGARLALPPAPRVIYVRNGAARIEDSPPTVHAGLGPFATTDAARIEDRPPTAHAGLAGLTTTAWHGTGAVALSADAAAVVLRFELLRGAAAGRPDAGTRDSRRLLQHAIELDPTRAWLMRCDRVEFAPGGVALPHGHKGGGIRCLLAGTLEVTVGDAPPRLMRPGDAWFESGREPVLARASADTPTAFVRVSILPAEIRGQSSIVYVDPADAARGRPRQYTVYVDEPLALI
jgi:quercetin dioxygenase-like cupin family protein